MNINIQSRNIEFSSTTRKRHVARLLKGLRRFEEEITAVDLYLSDVNGLRGGNDKRAQFRVSLRELPPVSVTTEHSHLYVAVERSSRRMRRTVRRLLRRKRRVQKRSLVHARHAAFA